MTFKSDLHLQQIPCASGLLYTIRAGDSIYVIARQYNTTVQAILAANPGINPNKLQIGEVICIPKTPAPPERGCTLILRSRPEGPAPNAAGVLFLQHMTDNKIEILIAASGLPSPTTIRANRYTAIFTWGRTTYDLSLLPVPGITGLWVENIRESFPPEFFNGSVGVYPGPVLGGLIANCR